MKVFVITLALAGLASAATVDAQAGSNRLPTTNSSIGVDGTWRVVGRDGNGYTIYERRTQDRYGNIIVQRARRDAKGNMSIISSNTVGNNTRNRNSRNCDYNRTTNSLSDLIFNRSNDVACNDVGNLEDNGWYQVGRGPNNNSIYMRRTRDANGRLVIQRGRLNRNGTFTILSTRPANDNDKQWQKEQKRQDKEYKKQQKQQNKSNRGNNDDRYRNDSYRNDNAVYRGNDNSSRNDYVAKGDGHGKGKDKGKHKGDK
jgi:hypothetical protein